MFNSITDTLPVPVNSLILHTIKLPGIRLNHNIIYNPTFLCLMNGNTIGYEEK